MCLSFDIFTPPLGSAKLASFVPLLILIETKGPPETTGPFLCAMGWLFPQRPRARGGNLLISCATQKILLFLYLGIYFIYGLNGAA